MLLGAKNLAIVYRFFLNYLIIIHTISLDYYSYKSR